MALQGTSMKMLLILTFILANFVTVHRAASCGYSCYHHGGKCYEYTNTNEYFWFVSDKKSYEDAKASCEERSGELWDPSDPYFYNSENRFVYNVANHHFGQDEEYWISTDWATSWSGGAWRSELERAKPTAKVCWDYTDDTSYVKKQGRAVRFCGMSTWRDNCNCYTEAANDYKTAVDCDSIPGSEDWDEDRAYVCHLHMDCSEFFGGECTAQGEKDKECCDWKHGKCGEDEGDCDHDYHCKAGLKCGNNNCPSGFPWHYDCCYKPNCQDNYNSCNNWKNQGYCSGQYSNWMADNCKNSCNKC